MLAFHGDLQILAKLRKRYVETRSTLQGAVVIPRHWIGLRQGLRKASSSSCNVSLPLQRECLHELLLSRSLERKGVHGLSCVRVMFWISANYSDRHQNEGK